MSTLSLITSGSCSNQIMLYPAGKMQDLILKLVYWKVMFSSHFSKFPSAIIVEVGLHSLI